MKKNIRWFTLSDAKFDNLFFILTYLISIFPILTYGLRSTITILWILTSVGSCILYANNNHKKTKPTLNRNINFYLLFSTLPYLILVFSLIYTENISEGVKSLTQMISLLVFPIGVYLSGNKLVRINIKMVQTLFISSVIILVVYQMIHAFINLDYLLDELSAEELKYNGLSTIDTLSSQKINTIKIRRFRKFISDLVDTHPTYQAVWICFSLYLMIKRLFIKKKSYLVFVYIFLIIVLLFWAFLISSRMPLIAGGIATLCVIFIGNLNFRKKIFMVFGILLFSVISYIFVDTLRVRVNQAFEVGFTIVKSDDKVVDFNSINIRNGIYFCGSKIVGENLLFGVGVGDTQDLLNECLINEVNPKIYSWRDYNSHNQYLSFMLDSGIIGFVLFVISLTLAFFVSIKNKDMDYLFFITLMSFVFLTENVLVRNDGILFYAFFNSIFLFLKDEESFKTKKIYDLREKLNN